MGTALWVLLIGGSLVLGFGLGVAAADDLGEAVTEGQRVRVVVEVASPFIVVAGVSFAIALAVDDLRDKPD